MKIAPKCEGTGFKSSHTPFGIYQTASKSHFSKNEKKRENTRKTQENLRFSGGIYFDP